MKIVGYRCRFDQWTTAHGDMITNLAIMSNMIGGERHEGIIQVDPATGGMRAITRIHDDNGICEMFADEEMSPTAIVMGWH